MDTLIKAVERFISGDWGEEKCSPDSSEKVVCIRGADIENVQGGIYDSIPNRYISSSSLANKKLKIGDIVIEKSGGSPTQSTGRTCYISEDLIKEKKDVVCSNFCAAFSIRETWDYKYIYYYIQNIYNQGNFFNFEGKTSGIRNLLLDTAFKSIPLPPIDKTIQTKLSGILERIDQKISLNTRMNAELEAMAKQLYDYWFVQFDFPFDFAQGKPDENGKPYKSSGGKMVWNEKLKREIPEGWEVKKMEELLVFSNGINYDKNIEGDKQYRIINVRNITSSSIFINKETLDVINLPSKQADNYLVGEDDIIIARSGTPGSTRLIMSPSGIIYCGFIIKGTPKEKDNKYILMYYLKQLEGTQATKTGGSILQNVSQDTLKSLLIIVPPKDIVVSFNNHEIKLFNGINACVESKNYLTKLRDSLLPMLMNGQVTIE